MTFAVDDATFVEMRDGGELGLIRNPRLGSELSTNYAINAAEGRYGYWREARRQAEAPSRPSQE